MSKSASAKVIIENELGLHARPVMRFVEVASGFAADVTVRRTDSDETVDGKAIMQMMMLAATQGTEVEINASGDDADTAVRELIALVRSGFGES